MLSRHERLGSHHRSRQPPQYIKYPQGSPQYAKQGNKGRPTTRISSCQVVGFRVQSVFMQAVEGMDVWRVYFSRVSKFTSCNATATAKTLYTASRLPDGKYESEFNNGREVGVLPTVTL